MIDRLEIMAVAGDLSLRPDVVEKDYVLGWILAGIYADPRLSKVWAFKGGTCLKKCYFETYRFSEDLDFTVLEPAHLEEAFLLAAFADVSRWVQDASGIEIPVEQLRFEPFRNKRGGSNCEGRLYYRGPMQRGGSLQRVKIDLTADERVVLPFADRPVGHPYTDRPEQGMTARCYAFEEVFAEKTRALGERSRPRDLYDVINLFRTEEYRPPSSAVLDVLRQKCAFKGIDLPSLSALALAEDELRADWDAMLGHQLPALPPFDAYWKALPEFFSWILAGRAPAPLTAAPIGAGEAVFRPAIGELRAARTAGSTYLETIRFAASNRLCVELTYDGSVRLIEPYSLRRTSEGNILLFACHAADGQSRSYRLDKISGARMTRQPFVPRFAVELSATEVSIPASARQATSFPASPGRATPRTRPARRQASGAPGVVHIFQCSVCGRKFRRREMDASLNPHKDDAGYPCPGRIGVYLETKFQ